MNDIIFGIHNHQPYGNFKEVCENTYRSSYLPFIKEVQNSDAKITIHFTGTLLEWLVHSHGEYIQIMKSLLKENRIEILSGGFYEPIMPSILPKFRIKQIDKMNLLIYKTFNYTPRGLWLAERVWESDIIPQLKASGIEYTFLDEEHFLPIGKSSDQYYITEYNGLKFKIFVINKELRYLIPFKPHEEAIKKLQDGNFFVAFDDGEKFGAWPGTYDLLYKSKWLKRFFNSIKENNTKMSLPNEIIDNYELCGGLVYLDSGTYPEMESWALPTTVDKNKYKKCNWKNFFVKYPESNFMHKLSLLNCKHCTEEKEEENIMASQANDAYWHGVFGGVYISHLRNAIYKNILKTQRAIRKNKIIEDIDFDGYNEILVKNEKLIIGIDPDQGGRIFELGNLSKEYNFQNTLSRKYEPYHEKEVIEDWYSKFSLIDHFLQFPTFEQIKKCKFNELGDFVNKQYEFEINDNSINLTRNGNLWINGKLVSMIVKKRITLDESEMAIHYILENPNDFKIPFHYATEFNFNFVSDYGEERYLMYNGFKRGIFEDYEGEIESIKFKDTYFDLDMELTFDKSSIWSYPIRTRAMSEKDKIETYQGTSIFINKIDTILPKTNIKFCIKIRF